MSLDFQSHLRIASRWICQRRENGVAVHARVGHGAPSVTLSGGRIQLDLVRPFNAAAARFNRNSVGLPINCLPWDRRLVNIPRRWEIWRLLDGWTVWKNLPGMGRISNFPEKFKTK